MPNLCMAAQPDAMQHDGLAGCETKFLCEMWLGEEGFVKRTVLAGWQNYLKGRKTMQKSSDIFFKAFLICLSMFAIISISLLY